MNTSTDEPTLDTVMYDYEYNSTCMQDPNPVLSEKVLQSFYYVVFCFGLLGKVDQMQPFKLKNKQIITD